MSQLHQEALRKQLVVDKKYNMNSGTWRSCSPGNTSGHMSKSSGGYNTQELPPVSYQATHGISNHPHSKQRSLLDPYLEALTKETRARTKNRFSSTEYMMQW